MKTQRDYIDPREATRLRVFEHYDDRWEIDGANDGGDFTECCWNCDGHPDEPLTRRRALELAEDFATENGLPRGLPVYERSVGGEWILVRPARALHD